MPDKKPKSEEQKIAQKQYQKKYMSSLETIHYRFPKAKKAIISEAAETAGLSLNAFVDRAVDHEIESVLGKDPADQADQD